MPILRLLQRKISAKLHLYTSYHGLSSVFCKSVNYHTILYWICYNMYIFAMKRLRYKVNERIHRE